jgi:small subunit ribosomal protein S16
MGKKKQPTYRLVAADSRSPRNGRFIEIVGTYDPRREPSLVKVDNRRAVHWLRNGAQPTARARKLLEVSGAWAYFESGDEVPEQEPDAPDATEATESTEATEAAEPVEAGADA